MPPKVFVTGATGYIGGDALVDILEAHPDWDITCSVRNSDKGAKIAAVYPQIKLVYGDLDAVEMIEEEASKADIVYHFANCDHEASAQAIARGLARREGSKPGFWIHTSGTLILSPEYIGEGKVGEVHPKVRNDWDGVSELLSLPDGAAHRPVDKIVIGAFRAHPEKIRTAIVCPPTIYGRGRGSDNQRSVQAYGATKVFLEQQQGFTIGKGENIWHQVHVQDLSKLYLALGEAASAGGPPATWNDQGYYLAENGSFVWGDVLRAIVKEAHKQGLLPSADTKEATPDEADKLWKNSKFRVGTNSRGESIRAKKLLGWTPKERSLMEEIPTMVADEARALGLTKGHAEKVVE
ncbi:hypothetical protein H2198_000772 [Neophaeococcomyces mojaviensis]|uniref:Uncharacterized protein n=1 Tax=Neophaeococcomyces mojaviensis TaxID=3383035 RepID=A0ACC3AIS1_9EURO|nr:hypothetical protein H2198_000772 [Knufia sp. JES_112]